MEPRNVSGLIRPELPVPNLELGGRLLADNGPILGPFGQTESTLAETVKVIRKRKWVLITSMAVMLVMAFLVSLRMTRQYDATALVAYNKEGNENLGFKDVPGAESDVGEEFSVAMDTQIKILQSDKIALGVISNLRLDENSTFTKGLVASFAKATPIAVQQVDRNREAELLRRFHEATTMRTVRNTRLIQITFRSPDPALAAAVVNNLVNQYVEENYRTRYESTMQASDWLAKQISDLQQRVETSQEKLVRYQRENGILGIDEKQNIVTQKLDELNRGLTEAEADRISKQAAFETAKAGRLDQLNEASTSELINQLRQSDAQLRSQYAQLTTTLGPNYPKSLEVKNQIDQTERSVQSEMQRIVNRLQSSYNSAQLRESMLRGELERQKVEANKLNEKAIDFSLLKRDLDANRTLYEGLLQKLKEAGVTAGLRSSNIRVVDVARVPTAPAVPNIPRNLALSLAIGLVGGIVLTLVVETLDNTVHTPDQVESLIGFPSLGLIPQNKVLEGIRSTVRGRSVLKVADQSQRLVAQIRPNSDVAESYRSLRTSLLLSSAAKPPRVILFTSPLPQDGKTTTSINVAIVLAQTGGRVLLVDADMRRPAVHQAFSIQNSAGLSSVLAGLDQYENLVESSSFLPNLFILPSGPIAPHPAELLASDRMRNLISKVRDEYDFVVVDTPPIIPVTDPAVLSAYVDAVILVIRAGKTSKNSLRHASNQLRQIKAPLTGIVVNGANMHSPDYYQYYYYGKLADTGYYHSGKTDAGAKEIVG